MLTVCSNHILYFPFKSIYAVVQETINLKKDYATIKIQKLKRFHLHPKRSLYITKNNLGKIKDNTIKGKPCPTAAVHRS